jgi:esterase/lipase superfamily enzyme
MTRIPRLLAVTCWLAMLASGAALAQPDLFTLRGVVIDCQGDPVPGTTLTLRTEGDETKVQVSDDQGEFHFEDVPAGSYRLTIQVPGLPSFEHSSVLDRAATRGMLLIRCHPDAGGEVRLLPPLEITPPGPPPPPPPPPEEGYAEIAVFYGTDRALRRSKPLPERFGPERMTWMGRLHLGVCRVSIPRDHRMGEIERPSIWKLEFQPDPSKHMVLLGIEELGPLTFYPRLQRHLGRTASKELLVFVHGYNVSFHDAALRTAQLAYDLGLDGAPVLYSWPSRASLAAYTKDEATVGWTAPHLEGFLRNLAARSGARSIYLVAHSMGNRALTRALERIALTMRGNTKPLFSEILLTAPDIDAGEFMELARDFRRTGERVTLYASSNDQALKASKKVHGFRRAGDSDPEVLVLSGIDTIDVSKVDTSLLGHSYVGDNCSVISDMYGLLRKREPPEQRFSLERKQKAAGLAYWIFSAATACPLVHRPP